MSTNKITCKSCVTFCCPNVSNTDIITNHSAVEYCSLRIVSKMNMDLSLLETLQSTRYIILTIQSCLDRHMTNSHHGRKLNLKGATSYNSSTYKLNKTSVYTLVLSQCLPEQFLCKASLSKATNTQ